MISAAEQKLEKAASGTSLPEPRKMLSLRRLGQERWFSEVRAVFGKVISKQTYRSAAGEWN